MNVSVVFVLDSRDNQKASGFKALCCMEADWRSMLNVPSQELELLHLGGTDEKIEKVSKLVMCTPVAQNS